MGDLNNYKLNNTLIKDKETGTGLVSLLVPEGWKATGTLNKKSYRGYGQSCLAQADLRPENNSTAIFYSSALHYKDDHLTNYSDFSTDLYGNLYRKFIPIEDFLDKRLRDSIPEAKNIKFVKQIVKDGWKEKENEVRKKAESELKDNMSVIGNVYYKQVMREYSFERDGYPRKRVVTAEIEAVQHVVWAPLPYAIAQSLNNPFMRGLAQVALSAFPYAQYDKNVRQWIYTMSYYTNWNVRKIFIMDAPERTYDELFNNVFVPIVNHGANYSKEYIDLLNTTQTQINAQNKQKREEQKRINDAKKAERERQRQIDEESRRRRQETWDYVRKTQDEISAMRKDTWEKQQKSQAKVREMWGDTLRGDTRFVDKYGDEHVIHTYDKYAYKSGSTYVTSDSPLDHGWDWEELEKKKY